MACKQECTCISMEQARELIVKANMLGHQGYQIVDIAEHKGEIEFVGYNATSDN